MASSSLSCTICVDNFENSSDLCSTVCGHVFHFSCLQQWQERSNTCPLCNQNNPQPHRLFLELPTVAPSNKSNNDDCNENVVIIKGIQPHLIATPLSDVVLNLAQIMRVSLGQSDIRDISRKGNNLFVTFYATRQKDMFLENKFRLKINQQTSGVVIHEVLDKDTKDLFHRAHRLKEFGYAIIFVKNKKIYAKKSKQDQPICIRSQDHVDSLCGKVRNTKPNQISSTAANPVHPNTVTSARVYNTPTAPPRAQLQPMDSESANLIRQIIMEDLIASDSVPLDTLPVHRESNATNRQNRDRLVVSLPLPGSEMEREHVWRRNENQFNNLPQSKSLKKSIMSVFQKITSKFK